jgi:hypothetical protein
VLVFTIYVKNNSTIVTQQSKQTEAASNGISIIIHDTTSVGLSFSIKNTSDKEYTYGEDYKLYIRKNNVWESVKLNENVPFTAIGYKLQPQSTTDTLTFSWKLLYGELPAGEYRFEKKFLFIRSPGDYDTFLVTQNFAI